MYLSKSSSATWISSFLGNRTQYVVVNGSKSSEQKVIYDVPQRSVLGPLLFILYINDLPDQLECMSLMFADDTTPLTRGTEAMQTEAVTIRAMEDWGEKNNTKKKKQQF